MFKNKFKKLFLMFSVILFNIFIFNGCFNNNLKVTYISTNFDADSKINQINIIDNYFSLVDLLKNDTPNKYNDSFFKKNYLLVFKNIESNQTNTSEISSYSIDNETLNVYIETKQVKNDNKSGHWWFILELKNNEFDNYEIIKIFKNGNEIIKDTKSNSLNQTIYYQSYSFDEVGVWPDFIGNEYNLSFKERRYHFILSFDELVAIFEKSIGSNIDNYFNSNIFDANVILCVVRDETSGTAHIKYSNFRVNDSKFSIKENFIYGGALVVSRYLDFVIIPKKLFINGNYNLQYYNE